MRAPVAHPVNMICHSFYIVIGVFIKMLPHLSLIPCAMNDMKKVRHHTDGHKRMSDIIKGYSPRVARAVCHHFKPILDGVIPTDTGIDTLPLFIWRTRLALLGVCTSCLRASMLLIV